MICRQLHRLHQVSFVAALFFCLLLVPLSSSMADSEGPVQVQDDTMLMFVGEDLEVLSIASRRQESAWQAPAVAQVVTREELDVMGIRTISQALEMIPGFYMAQKEWGTQPYLRGIPDSFLFLYDTVPLGSDVCKSLHPLDHELSLAPVKRIEVVRGPGSVLWGPDAFAGIVNVVPMTGKDLDGIETGILYGSPGDQGAFYVNVGHDAGYWDAFFSVSGRKGEEDDTLCNIVRLWKDEKTSFPYEDRFGEERPGRSHYFEVSGSVSFRDWFTVSGLLSDFKRPYAMSEELTWRESRSGPFGLIKLEAKKDLDQSSAVRFTGSYSWLDPEYEIIDLTLKQKERSGYGEVIYDRTFLAGQGLFAGGLSYRQKEIDDAPIWNGYLPGYLRRGNEYPLVPRITKKDYDTRLWSLFGQYTHKIGDVDLWLGLRDDMHDEYEDHVSYNAGVVWSPWSPWMFKVLYGTAYRTPFARQLLEEEKPELEEIKTLNVQIAWKPSSRAGLSLCGFASRIDNHIMEDPYAKLSVPNDQDIKGVEIEGYLLPVKDLAFSANLTLLHNSGPDETYKVLKYIIPQPDGPGKKVFEELKCPYDPGPESLFNLTGTWRPVERVTLFGRLGYFSSRRLICPRSKTFPSSPGVWLLDMSATVRDIVVSGLELRVSVRNVTDTHYETPGTYSMIEGEPFSAEVMLRKRW